MSDLIGPGGRFVPDGRRVLDFERVDTVPGASLTRVPLPPGSRIRIGSSPEGLLSGIRKLADESTGEEREVPVFKPGFGGIQVVFTSTPEAELPENITHKTILEGVRAGRLVVSEEARLLHGASREAIIANHYELLNDPTLGERITAKDNTQRVLRSVVAVTPSVIEPQVEHPGQAFATSIPLWHSEPDETIEVDIMVQYQNNGQAEPITVIDSADREYDYDRTTRVAVGEIAFRQYRANATGDAIDYRNLKIEVQSLPPSSTSPYIDTDRLPRIAAVLVTTGSMELETLATPLGDPLRSDRIDTRENELRAIDTRTRGLREYS